VFDSNLTTLASSVTPTSDYVSTRPRHRPPTRSFHTSRMLEHRATIGAIFLSSEHCRIFITYLDNLGCADARGHEMQLSPHFHFEP